MRIKLSVSFKEHKAHDPQPSKSTTGSVSTNGCNELSSHVNASTLSFYIASCLCNQSTKGESQLSACPSLSIFCTTPSRVHLTPPTPPPPHHILVVVGPYDGASKILCRNRAGCSSRSSSSLGAASPSSLPIHLVVEDGRDGRRRRAAARAAAATSISAAIAAAVAAAV